MKKITLLFLFLVGSITSSFGQFNEGFEAGIPATWTVINGGDTNTWEANTFTPHGGLGDVSIGYSSTAHDDHLVTPAITVTAGVSDRFSFWVRSRDPDYPEQIDLLISTTTPDAAAFTVVLESGIAPDSGADWYEYTYDLSDYVGQTIYISFYSSTTDMFRFDIDDVVNDTPPSVAPGCVALTAPTDAATGIDFVAPLTLSWDAPTTGGAASSYDVFLDTNAAPTTLLGNQTALTRNVTGLLPSTTYYWKVVAKNAAGDATGCSTFSFTTASNPFAPYCGPLSFTNNVEPITLVNFAGINNTTSEVLNGTPDHEDFISTTGNVTAGSSYTITLKGNTDGNFVNRFMVFADWNQDGDFADGDEAYTITQTITNSTGIDAVQATQSLAVPPTATAGTTRMRVKKIYGTTDYTNPCLATAFGQVEDYSLAVTAAPSDAPDFANLQFPYTATIAQTQTVTVYGQVYEAGLTDVAPNIVGQAPGINAWVGVSTTDTNPNTWTNWTPATWNSSSVGNNDEYQLAIGGALAPGTYYYATRFQLNGGVYVYGATNNGFWNGTTNINGVLTVTAPVAPANNECAGAIALTPGGVYADNDIDGTNLASTLSADTPAPTCGAFNFATAGKDVWYSVVVPASGTLTIETSTSSAGGGMDTVFSVYSGACGSLAEVGCDDDGATETAFGLSKLSLTGQTPGATLLIRLFGYNGGTGTYSISAYDASLANPSFDNANFTYYPNPVKNVLNLSYNKEISNVEVYNLLGQQVKVTSVNSNEAQIDMSNLANGAYMVKVTSENQVKTIKVIKQ